MTVISLERVVNASFVKRFQGLATGAAGSTNPFGGSSNVSISDGLRLGARTFATAVQGLNATISFVNISRNTLGQLGKVVDTMVDLAQQASERGVGSDGRSDLNLKFKKLVERFREVVKNSDIAGDDYLSSEGIGAILRKIGLTEETSAKLTKIFDAFALPKTEDKFASERFKAARPLEIPDSVFDAAVSKTIYRARNVSNYSGAVDPNNGGISPSGGVFLAADTLLQQNPGASAVFVADQNGTITTQAGGTLVPPNDITKIMAVNELNLNASSKPGYSIVKSTGNLFNNYNASNLEQLFMLDAKGKVVAQITNNSGNQSFTSADLSADGLTYAVAAKQFNGLDYSYSLSLVTAGAVGEDPAATWGAPEVLAFGITALDGPGYENVSISADKNYVLFSNSPGGSPGYNLYQTVAGGGLGNDPSVLGLTSSAIGAGFVGASNQIAFANATDVQTYTFNAGSSTTVLSGASIQSFATLGTASASGVGGYFSYFDSASLAVNLYSVNTAATAATAVDMNSSNSSTSYSLGAGATVGKLSLALRSDGHVDIGLTVRGIDIASADTQLVRLSFNTQSLPGRKTGLSSNEPSKILDYDLSTRPEAFRALQDLKKMKEQIKDNIDTLDDVTKFIGENLDLVRAAGFAFLDLSNQLATETDAEKVARELQDLIRRNARGSLAQAENLTSIVVASLTFGS